MNIGFDGKRAANNLTGLGNYSRSLIAQLAGFFPQNRYFVYTPKIKNHPQINRFLSIPNILTELPNVPGLFWRTSGIKKQLLKDNIDLFHGLSHEIPLGIHKSGIPSVVTIHDLIFLKFPQYFGRIDRFIYNLKFRYACKNSNRIVAISEQTKNDIIEHFNIDPEKIEVIYQSCDDSFKIASTDQLKESVRLKYQLPEKYILNVGTIETRKNLLTLVKALKQINEDHVLVVVGRKTKYADLVNQEIDKLNLRPRIIFLQDIPFNELPSIYQMAAVFVYPSVYEGFGIPVIEALYAHVPVVAATGSCLEEAGGKYSSYVSPFDHNGFAKAINHILDHPKVQKEMIEKGKDYVQRFNTEIISKEMMGLYTDVLKLHRSQHSNDAQLSTRPQRSRRSQRTSKN
ncbi:glycosyltransferase family 4 protein [Pedobacter metabolipauper]|uniref:Glycosyltransferase involved in cell wall biosynthesis n=1 Tax=Pedobacter metabolipauper TaxID=425513 RepID=A0A4R6SS43_9SPHI|nr:glycosyltransferase family 1 protein [Pedobacter metabolipauper]TDQ07423.1 glycosyltransferase involved in cell wall biosynthesis [Pedobacter metabolipauper]